MSPLKRTRPWGLDFLSHLRNLRNLRPLGFLAIVHAQRVLKNEPWQRPKLGQLQKGPKNS
jgi:hypothetical protein